jgi:hypothetical protein
MTAASGPPPAPAGGALGDGIYVLTSAKEYGTKMADGATLGVIGSFTLEVTGPVIQVLSLDDKGKEERQTYTTSVSGSTMTMTQTCRYPSGTLEPPQSGEFTATGTAFHTIIAGSGTGTFDITYTRPTK